MVSKWTCNNKNLSKKCVSRRLYFYQFEGLFSSIIRQSSLTKYGIAFLNKWTVKFLFQSEMIKYTVLSAILLVKVYTLTFVRTVYDVLSKELRNWPKFTTHIKNKFSICFIPLRGLPLDHYCVNKHEPAFFFNWLGDSWEWGSRQHLRKFVILGHMNGFSMGKHGQFYSEWTEDLALLRQKVCSKDDNL